MKHAYLFTQGDHHGACDLPARIVSPFPLEPFMLENEKYKPGSLPDKLVRELNKHNLGIDYTGAERDSFLALQEDVPAESTYVVVGAPKRWKLVKHADAPKLKHYKLVHTHQSGGDTHCFTSYLEIKPFWACEDIDALSPAGKQIVQLLEAFDIDYEPHKDETIELECLDTPEEWEHVVWKRGEFIVEKREQ